MSVAIMTKDFKNEGGLKEKSFWSIKQQNIDIFL